MLTFKSLHSVVTLYTLFELLEINKMTLYICHNNLFQGDNFFLQMTYLHEITCWHEIIIFCKRA